MITVTYWFIRVRFRSILPSRLRFFWRQFMRRTSMAGLVAFAVSLVISSAACAQPQVPPMPHPRLLVVTPPGGKAGSTVEVTLSGQELDAPQSLMFSTPGIKAELVNPNPAPPVDPKKPAPKQPMQAPTGSVKFKVTIPADVRPGIHDLRVVTALGISNPRAFVVGDLDEVLE